jgi:hypothetical protein
MWGWVPYVVAGLVILAIVAGGYFLIKKSGADLGTAQEREKAIREAQKRLQKAQEIRRRARKRGTALLDSLQNRPK